MDNPVLIPIFGTILGTCCALVAIFGALVVRPWIRLQHEKLAVEADLARERASIDAARQERLEARVAVLERIVTDRGMGLADEIERLRDKPLN